jgi:hypothetical protein
LRLPEETAGGASAPPSVDCGGVPSPDSTRKLATVSRTKTLILLVFLFSLAALVGARFSQSLQGTDFPDFYCAARMLAEGHGHQLYDADLQRQYQARYAGRVGTLYIHPPFEAVLYLAVAWLPLRTAYLLWFLLNLAFLGFGLHRLSKEALVPWDWRVLLVASLTFVPVLLCLQQGQDSLFLLLVAIFAFAALRRGRFFTAGCWLGIGLFKFQVVLPLALVFILTQRGEARKQLAKGFSLSALALTALSAGISGWSVFTAYPRFLLHLHEQPFAGIVPRAMANFRGLAFFFFRGDQSYWTVAGVTILCTAALVQTLVVWKHALRASHSRSAVVTAGDFDLAFANTMLFALLVSYHLNPHDLSLLLLPIFLLLRRTFGRTPSLPGGKWITAGLLGILFLPPLHLWALQAGVYALVSVPLLALFLVSAFLTRQSRTA